MPISQIGAVRMRGSIRAMGEGQITTSLGKQVTRVGRDLVIPVGRQVGAPALFAGLDQRDAAGVLAAVLIVTGYKLAKPQLFRTMWNHGLEQFLPFIITVSGVVFTDLLTGVALGMATAIVMLLVSTSMAMSWILAFENIPTIAAQTLLAPITHTTSSKARTISFPTISPPKTFQNHVTR